MSGRETNLILVSFSFFCCLFNLYLVIAIIPITYSTYANNIILGDILLSFQGELGPEVRLFFSLQK